MKKYGLIIFVWILILTPYISSDTKELSYVITFDKNINSYEVKRNILDIYSELTENVYEESYEIMVKKNLKKFKITKDTKVKFKNHTLYIYIGKNSKHKIKGTLESSYVCSAKIKPKSLIQSLFD